MILFLVQNPCPSTWLDVNGSLMGTPILSNDTMAAEWKRLIFLQLSSACYLSNSYILPYYSWS